MMHEEVLAAVKELIKELAPTAKICRQDTYGVFLEWAVGYGEYDSMYLTQKRISAKMEEMRSRSDKPEGWIPTRVFVSVTPSNVLPERPEVCRYACSVDTGIALDKAAVISSVAKPEHQALVNFKAKSWHQNFYAAVATFKRTAKEWPTCTFGGEIHADDPGKGTLHLVCEHCADKLSPA